MSQPKPSSAKKPARQPIAITQPDPGAPPDRLSITILAAAIAFSIGVIYEWEPLNGLMSLTRWEWPWQDLGVFEMALALLPSLLLTSLVWRFTRAEVSVSRGRVFAAILAVSHFAGQIFTVLGDPRGFERIKQIVLSAGATSYMTDALQIQDLRAWLGSFHHASLSGHSATHPAGPILFYYAFAKLGGPESGALLGALAVAAIASTGVAVVYLFAGLWTEDRRVRLLAAALYAFVPALTVFFPELDQVYPIFAMLMIWSWAKALEGSARHAAILGAVVFAASFFAYNLLTVGAFLVFYAAYRVWTAATSISTTLRSATITAGVLSGVYAVLWAATGYNAPAALAHALKAQTENAAALNRQYSIFVFADLYDFALGGGVLAALLALAESRRIWRTTIRHHAGFAMTILGLATILTVDVSGLLRAETARVWMFLQPLVVVPAAVAVARFSRNWQAVFLALAWWILVAIKARMSFVEP